MKKFFPLSMAIMTLLLISCGDFFDRYDPLEAARDVYDIDSFFLPNWLSGNVGVLYVNAQGQIDYDNNRVNIPIPPSIDLFSTPLSAEIQLKNIGVGGDETKTVYINDRIWGDDHYLKISKDFAGVSNDNDEVYYEPVYDIVLNPAFLCELYATSYYYSDIPSFSMGLQFNDTAAPGHLTSADFIAGLKGNNFDSASLINTSFSPILPNTGEYYSFNINALSEGPVQVYFDSGSVLEDISWMPNKKSNEVQLIYDYTAPSIPSSTIVVDGINSNPADYNDLYLRITFPEAIDNFTAGEELYYHFYFSLVQSYLSDAVSTESNGTLLGSYYRYQDSFYWDYSAMPSTLTAIFTSPGVGTTIYFNVIVSDLAGNKSIYTTTAPGQIYLGP